MEWLAVLLLGGAVGLDATSFPQAMYSRPFVAGALAGFLVGRPVEGALIGTILEFFSLPVLPFGATGYPEGGTAAVAATVAYTWMTDAPDANLAFLTVALGLLLSHASGYSVRLLRTRNGWAVGGAVAGEPIEADVIERRHLTAMALDFLRGALVTTAGAAVIALVIAFAIRVGWSLPFPPLDVLVVAVAMMIGGTLSVFGTLRNKIVPFVVGAAVAALAVWVL